jgi:hypothetical protein
MGRDAELADQVERALWSALGDRDADVQWGAVRALIEASDLSTRLFENSSNGQDGPRYGSDRYDQQIENLSRLWTVVLREAPKEQLATRVVTALSRRLERDELERRALLKLLDGDGEIACAAAYLVLGQKDDQAPMAVAVLIKHGLTDANRRGQAERTLDEMLAQPPLAPLITDALNRVLWAENHQAAWAAARYALERKHVVSPATVRGLVFGGLLTSRWREAESQIRDFLADVSVRPWVIDALNVAMYQEETDSVPARLLVEAGAPLHDRIIESLNDMALWQPWALLAVLRLTRRVEEVCEAAARTGCTEMLGLLGADQPTPPQKPARLA